MSGYHVHTFNQSRGRLGQIPGSVSRFLPQLSVFTQHGPWSLHSGDTANDKLQNKAPERQQRPVLPQPHASRFPGVGSDFVVEVSSDQEPGLTFLPLIQKITGDAEPEVFLNLPYIGRQPPQSWHRTHQTPNSHYKRDFFPQRGSKGGGGRGEGQNQTASSMSSKQEIKQTAANVVFCCLFVLQTWVQRR